MRFRWVTILSLVSFVLLAATLEMWDATRLNPHTLLYRSHDSGGTTSYWAVIHDGTIALGRSWRDTSFQQYLDLAEQEDRRTRLLFSAKVGDMVEGEPGPLLSEEEKRDAWVRSGSRSSLLWQKWRHQFNDLYVEDFGREGWVRTRSIKSWRILRAADARAGPNVAGFTFLRERRGFHNGDGFVVPLWALTALFAIPPVLLLAQHLQKHRRKHREQCPACGYDLRATPDRCPECGAVTVPASAASASAPSAELPTAAASGAARAGPSAPS